MRSSSTAAALLALALLAGATGCGDDATDDAGSAPSPVAPAAPSTAQTADGTVGPRPSTPPFPADTAADDGGTGSGNGLGLVDVRTARHAGYDRVVFEFAGTGTPEWRAAYTTDPRADGSGDPVRLKGTAYLQVLLRGLGMPFDTGVTPYDVARVPGDGTAGVAEIAPGGVFEGDQLAFIGLTGAERPFRVFALTDPTRVVVDVQH